MHRQHFALRIFCLFVTNKTKHDLKSHSQFRNAIISAYLENPTIKILKPDIVDSYIGADTLLYMQIFPSIYKSESMAVSYINVGIYVLALFISRFYIFKQHINILCRQSKNTNCAGAYNHDF